jgi:hypothetical protein
MDPVSPTIYRVKYCTPPVSRKEKKKQAGCTPLVSGKEEKKQAGCTFLLPIHVME